MLSGAILTRLPLPPGVAVGMQPMYPASLSEWVGLGAVICIGLVGLGITAYAWFRTAKPGS